MEVIDQPPPAPEGVAAVGAAEGGFSFSDALSAISEGLLAGQRQEAIRRHLEGDIHVGTMAAAARLVPGSKTAQGKRAIHASLDRSLDRVRASIRDRTN